MAHACPDWEYENLPTYRSILGPRVRQLEKVILAPGHDTLKFVQDTRVTHKALFKSLTPALYPEFAGNYRGSPVGKCLPHLRVQVPQDGRVGSPPDRVEAEMNALAELMKDMLDALDGAAANFKTDEERLSAVVVTGCHLIETFLRIHPYANGNGHIARTILWAILARYGYRFRHTFQIEPKPPFMDQYAKRLSQYRDGDKDPLHKFILQCVVKPATTGSQPPTAPGA